MLVWLAARAKLFCSWREVANSNPCTSKSHKMQALTPLACFWF
uniref:Uncharacterized protein n=1 Tax=Rhizophora mucronata TaxID=61149 RepID=A0A2P2K2P4_RHIMU